MEFRKVNEELLQVTSANNVALLINVIRDAEDGEILSISPYTMSLII